jgi:three-Cys-motif partner protein
MPSRKHGVIWEAKPHTLAKIAILSDYIHQWTQILGRSRRGQGLVYIDGFAGPGEYTNSPNGSPIAALGSIADAISLVGPAWLAGDVHCAFIEADRARLEHLRVRVAQLSLPPQVKVHLIGASFTEGLARLRSEVPRAFGGAHPLLVFVDPFGATGAPFAVVAHILGSPCSEVLVNLDADGIGRIFQAGETARAEDRLTEVFGDISWRSALSKDVPFTVLCGQVLDLYRARLRSLPNCRYVFSFEMRTSSSAINYYLVFASQHHRGLEKMKEAMRRVDQYGNFSFTDTRVGDRPLFRLDDPEVYARRLLEAFRGREVSYGELRDYALNETPFVNPKQMLRCLEQRDLLVVRSRNPRRRRGDFPEETTVSIGFAEEW